MMQETDAARHLRLLRFMRDDAMLGLGRSEDLRQAMDQLDELSLQVRQLDAKDLETARSRAAHPDSQASSTGSAQSIQVDPSTRLMSYKVTSEQPDIPHTLVDESHLVGPLYKADSRLQADGIPKVYIHHGDLFFHIVTSASADAQTTSIKGSGKQESVQDIQVALCPDSNGITKGKYSNHFRQVVTGEFTQKSGPKISLTESMNGSADVSATVNDSAEIARYDFGNMVQGTDWTAEAENASRGLVRAGYLLDRAGVSVSGRGTFLLEIPSLTGRFKVNADEDVAAEIKKRDPTVHLLLNLNNAFESVKEAYAIAHEYWTNGNCVAIVADQGGVTTLKPGESAAFTARVLHKSDGGVLHVPVTATATLGSVYPGTSKSPADFSYRAPSETPKDGRFRAIVETSSQRGRDKREVTWMGPITRWKIDGTYTATEGSDHCAFCASRVEVTFSAILILGYLSIPSVDPRDPVKVHQSPIFEGDGEAHVKVGSVLPRCTVTDSGTQPIHINATPLDESGYINLPGTNLAVSAYALGHLKLRLCSFPGGGRNYEIELATCDFRGPTTITYDPIVIPARDGGTWVSQGAGTTYKNIFSELSGITCESFFDMTHSWRIVLSIPPA